jgi:hypothetical protein
MIIHLYVGLNFFKQMYLKYNKSYTFFPELINFLFVAAVLITLQVSLIYSRNASHYSFQNHISTRLLFLNSRSLNYTKL